MENLEQYLATLLSAEPLIAQAIQGSEDIRKLAASSAGRRVVAARLKAMESEAAHKRGEFIEWQVSGGNADELFNSWREHWGIPAFQEKLVDLSDFQNGFMWRFRDHTTSWSENQQAQEWFLTSLEAQTITRYEL